MWMGGMCIWTGRWRMRRGRDEPEAADRVQKAMEAVYTERKTLTRDVGGTAGTVQFTDAILAAMG